MVTFDSLIKKKDKIAIVGLGYVGLPLAVHLARHFAVVGFDTKPRRIEELKAGRDRTLEVADAELAAAAIEFTSDPAVLSHCRLIIVAVPTPIDEHRIPDLTPVKAASTTAGKHMTAGTCVVFESTVYPGVTEDVCVPILAAQSGLAYQQEFTVGYSPERINPGDKVHTLEKITKIVAGSTPESLQLLTAVYGQVVKAGIHRASSIKVAEAAKVIENTQRDINIALMNELAMIFQKIGIDTLEVLEAAGTKWNFLPFRPGLVGGHCIGVDPYYLTFKAESLGYHPEMILAGRRINDQMGKYVAERTIKALIKADKSVRGATVAILGLTFKEDVPDLRNTRVIDIVNELQDYGVMVKCHDPMADADEARKYYGITIETFADLSGADAVILAVGHRAYKEKGLAAIAALCADRKPIVFDLKGVFDADACDVMDIVYGRL